MVPKLLFYSQLAWAVMLLSAKHHSNQVVPKKGLDRSASNLGLRDSDSLTLFGTPAQVTKV